MQGRKVDEWEQDIKTARELHYPKEVIEALAEESDSFKRSKILLNARLSYGR